jgi:hypothetical protein
MHQQLWGHKVEEKLYVGVREQKRLNTAGLSQSHVTPIWKPEKHEDICLDNIGGCLRKILKR